MVTYKNRPIESAYFLGNRIDFIASNDRVQERVSNLSNERYVLETLCNRGTPSDVFWDIGSCLGIHSFLFAKQYPQSQVVSFEPMPSNRSVSIDNKSVNELQNISIDPQAISNTTGVAEFNIRESIQPGYGRHGLSIGSGYDSVQTIEVETVTGDSVQYPQPNIVKVDVEGAGPLVLEGMEHTLTNPDCHTIIFETHEPNPVQPSHEDVGYTVTEIIELLESYNFAVSSMENEFHLLGVKDQTELEVSQSDTTIKFVTGDIADVSGDTVINSAGTSLYFGTGVAGSLSESAGSELQEAALKETPVTLGSAILTDAYDLPYDTVAHAVSMPHYGRGQSTPRTVYMSVRNALQMADKNGSESVVCPAVGCGLGGVSLSRGIEKILQAITGTEFNSIETVSICLYTEDEYKTITNLYQ
jgi:FkbM family methyltransferase